MPMTAVAVGFGAWVEVSEGRLSVAECAMLVFLFVVPTTVTWLLGLWACVQERALWRGRKRAMTFSVSLYACCVLASFVVLNLFGALTRM